MNRRDILNSGLAALATTTLAPLTALAQGMGQARYPERPIRLVVPFAPGGATDVAGRLWAEKMKPLIGTIVVENKPSGGGAPGTTEVARAQPDGYTLLFGNTSTQVLLPVLMPKPPYDPVKDFTAISILCVSPTVIVVNEKVPVRTLRELIAYAKTNPGKLSYGSAGSGTLTNLAGELFKQLIGAPDIVHIPYKGSAPGVADLAAGHIPMMTPNIGGPLIDFHRAGRVRILAVAHDTRLKVAPDIPTAIEAGLPGMVASNFNGLFAPAGLSPAIVGELAQATRKVMDDQEFQRALTTKLGLLGEEPCGIGGCADHGIEPQVAQLRAHRRPPQDVDHVAIDARRERCRHGGRANHGKPGDGAESRQSRFRDGRDIGQRRCALVARHCHDANPVGLMQRHRGGECIKEHVDVAGDEIVQRGRGAAIGHMHHLDAGADLELRTAQVRGRAAAL
jgi:tripartite-type tricarboxylate transporter receptor subunit TctC